MTTATLPQPRLRRVEVESMIRSDGFVVVVQRDEVGCEQMIIFERGQLVQLAANAEMAYQLEEHRQRRARGRARR